MKNSKRLIRILHRSSHTAPRITCSSFFTSYLEEDAFIPKEVKHYLLQANAENKFFNSLRDIEEETKFSFYNGYLLSDALSKAFVFGAARAEQFNQVIMTEAHVLEGIISSLPTSKDWKNLLQLACTAQDLLITFPLPKIEMTNAADVTLADTIDLEEILLFAEDHFGLRWVSQVKERLMEKEGAVYVVREKGRIAGFACCLRKNECHAVFGPMGVRKECRDSNYGRSLVLTIFQQLNELNLREVIISQAGPIEFYERILPVTLYPKQKG